MSDSTNGKRPLIINLFPKRTEASLTEDDAQAADEVIKSSAQGATGYDPSVGLPPSYGDTSYSSSDSEQSDSENESSHYERKFQYWWTTLFPFLQYDPLDNVMFCKVCRTFASTRQRGMQFVAGTNNFKPSTIRYHANSALHAKCKKLAEDPASGVLESDYLDPEQEKVLHILKSVYFAVKTKTPYTYFPNICKKQGIDVGSAYTSHEKVMPRFGKYIALSFEKELSQRLLNVPLFSLVLDSSLRRANESHELVYIKYLEGMQPKCSFLGVIDSRAKSGDAIHDALTTLFDNYGIKDWTKRIVYLICDKSNSFCLWHERLLNRLQIHCVENFVCDVHTLPHKIRKCTGVFQNSVMANKISSFIWDIFWYCDKVSEEKKKPLHIGRELDKIFKNFGHLPKNLFITFYFDALNAVMNDWASIVHLLRTEHNLTQRMRKVRARLAPELTKSNFLYELALFIDLLSCLDRFAKKLEHKETLPYIILEAMQDTCRDIVFAAKGQGLVFNSIEQEFLSDASKFRGIAVRANTDVDELLGKMQELEEALIQHLRSLMKDTCLLESSVVLETRMWPAEEQLIEYGNDDFCKLYFLLGGSQENLLSAFSEWLVLKSQVSMNFAPELRLKPRSAMLEMVREFEDNLPVVCRMLHKLVLLNFADAEVERGYHEMNLVKSSERSMLSVHSLQDLMVLCMHGPPMSAFDPEPAFHMWQKKCRRRYRNKMLVQNACE